jgi:predicted protein tyrosine phosphatase
MIGLSQWLFGLLDYSKVTPQIAVGSAFAARHIAQLRKQGFTAVVDCRQEATDDMHMLAEVGIGFLHLPVRDHHIPSIGLLAHGVDWVADHLGRVDRGYVLVHCQEGIGRSPLLVGCVLVAQGYTAAQALGMIRYARPRVAPNRQQLMALLDFERDWRAVPRNESVDPVSDGQANAG